MNTEQWMLIFALAIGAYSIRFIGLIAGDVLNRNKFLKTVISDLPGCLLVALIAASLVDGNLSMWVAALIALTIAIRFNNILITMGVGLLVLLIFENLITQF